MDKELRNLKRLSAVDPLSKDRYIRALERIVGLGEESEEATMQCMVNNCSNHANEGGGLFIMTQPNDPGQPPGIWDKAVGPLFICNPCYHHLQKWREEKYGADPGAANNYMVSDDELPIIYL